MPKSVADLRRQEIVASAVSAIQREGLPFPSYDAVAREAGMSRQLVRHYFPDAESLMGAVSHAISEVQQGRVATGLARGDESRLGVLFDYHLGLLDEEDPPRGALQPVEDALVVLACRAPDLLEALAERQDELRLSIVSATAESYPSLPPAACEEIAFVFVSLVHGHWRMVRSFGFDRVGSLQARAAMDRLLRAHLEAAMAEKPAPVTRRV
ncbi:TetR/AcrR family transcriptional regulator [Haematobacter genomosp. 1]|nr:TetR/AcrR family transcriptional regulator [Haematobacter genomosp. 1]